jgi:hypothetical protein
MCFSDYWVFIDKRAGMLDKRSNQTFKFYLNVLTKGLLLFLVVDVLFGFLQPLPLLGNISAYNLVFPGRKRLPYGDDPTLSYNLTLFQIDSLFASHEIDAKRKPAGEFRVIVIGDSSIWGFLLQPDQTLSGQLNALNYVLPDGRRLRAYNLGYPGLALTKDLLILSYALKYNPDLVVWPITLESFPYNKQLTSPLVQNNPDQVRALINRYQLDIDANHPGFVSPTFWGKSLVGQRRVLSEMIRLQIYGGMWAATGIDQYIPTEFTPVMENLPADPNFDEFKPPHLDASRLSFPVLDAGIQLSLPVPVLLVNEPIFISAGENSDLRYNFYYPRWAYDDYRQFFTKYCQAQNLACLDLWDAIDPREFTNTAIHMTPKATGEAARMLLPAIIGTISGE